MSKILIIVEGGADAVFLNNYIHTLLPAETPPFEDLAKFKKGKNVQICSTPHIKILIAGGCTHVKQYKNTVIGFQDQGYKVLMVQDADNPVKDKANGGVDKRMKYLNELCSEFKISFQTFLFPDNKSDGDLEQLLLSIAHKDMYEAFSNCYRSYAECVSNFADEKQVNELMQDKYLIYNYCQVYQGAEMSNEAKRNYVSKYWNLNHDALSPLKEFLVKELGL